MTPLEVIRFDRTRVSPGAHSRSTTRPASGFRGDVTTNHAEGYFSQLKRSIDGTHHHVSQEHLGRYLAEFDFR